MRQVVIYCDTGRCAASLRQWGYSDNPLCICGDIYTYILTAIFVTHWNVRAQPELGLECAAEGGRLAFGGSAGQRPANVRA